MRTMSSTESSEMQGFNNAYRICKKILNSSYLIYVTKNNHVEPADTSLYRFREKIKLEPPQIASTASQHQTKYTQWQQTPLI